MVSVVYAGIPGGNNFVFMWVLSETKQKEKIQFFFCAFFDFFGSCPVFCALGGKSEI